MNIPSVQARLAPLALGALLAGAAPWATAATSSASVLVTSFSVVSSGPALSWSDPYQSFSAKALLAGGLLGARSDAFDTGDYGFAVVGATLAAQTAAVSTTTPQTFWATADTATTTGADTNLPNQSEALALQSGSFSLAGAGSVTFNVGYRLTVAAPAGGSAAVDQSWTFLALSLDDTDGSSTASSDSRLFSFEQGSGSAVREGSFTLTLNLGAGETGFYDLQGHASAFSSATLPVPEPGPGVLLAFGLAGLAGWIQARRKAA
jgi:hypothetical protein